MGIGDWGLGIGDWGLGPIPNPQSPIPNPHYILYNFIQILINFPIKYIYLIFLIIKCRLIIKPKFGKYASSSRKIKKKGI